MTSTTYAAWSTYAPITIANAPGVADYPVRVDLTFAAGMNANFSDVRFVDASDNALSYWIESYTAKSSAVVWVKVASGTTAIGVVYGNAAATSESSISDTFAFGDDFNRATSSTVGNDWTETVASGYSIYTNRLSIAAVADTVGCYHALPVTGVGDVVAVRITLTSTGGRLNYQRIRRFGPSEDKQMLVAVYSSGIQYHNGSACVDLVTGLSSGWYTVYTRYDGDTWSIRLDGGEWVTGIGFFGGAYTDRVSFAARSNGSSYSCDHIYQYTPQATEPVCTVGTAGSNSTALSESVSATLALSGVVTGTATYTRAAAAASLALSGDGAWYGADEPGEASLALSGTATGTAAYVEAAAATLAFSGAGLGGADEPGEASLALSGTATGAATSARTASASLAHAGAVTGTAAYVEAAAATLAFSGAGAGGAGLGETAEASLAFSGAGLGAIAYGAAGAASLAFTGTQQVQHWIDFDQLPVTTTTTDPLTGYPVTYPTGTVAIPAVTASVRRGVSDVCWQLTETVDGAASIPITSLRATKVTRQDHNGTARCVFFGVVPGLTYHLAYQADSTSANGYDYGWYLSQQYVPSAYRIMPATMNPSDFVTAMLGGNFWETATGVRPYRIATVTAWGTSVLPAKEFVFEPRTTKWEAIQQLAEYCGFVFFTKWIPVGVADVANPDPSQRVVQVNAVDFDAVEGTGYHDVDPVNLGGAYRTAEGVDIERFSTERGASVGWIRDGEWLKFTRTFDWSGRYAVSARVAAATEATATYWTLYLDDVEQFTVYVGAQTLANGGYRTGAYNIFTNTDPDKLTAAGVTVADAAQYIDIAEGEHVIKITFGGNVGAAPNNKHQNFTGLTLTPEGAGSAAGADTLYEPVAYWVADANIDSRAAGLDLPAPVVISDPGQYPRDGAEVMENANERYNSVTVRGHSESGVYFEYTASFVSDGLPREKFEESDRIVDAASAQTYALALLDYYKLDQKSYRLSLPQRFDLSLYQLITFVGHAKLPTTACRIVDVEHHSGHQDDWTTIEIVPNTTWLRGRKLRRMLFPSAVHETQAIVDHALAALPQPHIGVCATVGTDTGAFALEEGGTMTARIVD